MTKTPNLFYYGTKELSQDAFLAWLAAWADTTHATHTKLHQAALDFLSLLTNQSLHHETLNVTTRTQYNKIDLVIEIENVKTHTKSVIAIEDKTYSGVHSNQLRRYFDTIEKLYKEYDKRFYIYLKTGDPVVRSCPKPWSIIKRGTLLARLEKHKDAHPIIKEFYNHWNPIEEKYRNWEITPFSNKEPDKYPHSFQNSTLPWWGLYDALYDELKDGRSSYVPNKQGGFSCYTCSWLALKLEDEWIYLQFEQNRDLYMRIGCWHEHSTPDQVDAYRQHIIQNKNQLEHDWDYARSRKGYSMRVLCLKDAIDVQSNNTINFAKTIKTLKTAIHDVQKARTIIN